MESLARGKLCPHIFGFANFMTMTKDWDRNRTGCFGQVIEGMDIVDSPTTQATV